MPLLGFKHSEETKRKMSKAHTGEKHHMWGKHHTEKTKERLRIKLTGRTITDEWKQKIGDARRGRKHSLGTKQKIGMAHRGMNHTEESKRKISKTTKKAMAKKEIREKLINNHADVSGANNSQWLGGKSFEPYGLDFDKKLKENIKNRDGNSCQFCGVIENKKKLMIHHIDYDKENNDDLNLITLCNSHHSITNFNRPKWQFLFEVYQELRL